MAECSICKKTGKYWNGDDAKCAFPEGKFTSDNWHCATMLRLRDIAEAHRGRFYNDDGTIGVVPIPAPLDVRGYIVMNWYKDRCRTDRALILNEDDDPKELTEDIALKTIQYWEQFMKSKTGLF